MKNNSNQSISHKSNPHNEQIASYLEQNWPNRFSEFCFSLRNYPLPISSGAAATVLHGGSTEAVLAVDSFYNSAYKKKEESESHVSNSNISNSDRQTWCLTFSPFRYFRKRQMNQTSLLSYQSKDKISYNYNDSNNENDKNNDILFSLFDSSLPLNRHDNSNKKKEEEQLSVKELRAKCASKGLLTNGTKKELLARLRQHEASQLSSAPISQSERIEERQKQQPQKEQEQQNKTILIGEDCVTPPRKFILTNEEMLEHSQRLRTPFRSPSITRQSPPPESQPKRILGTPEEFVEKIIQQRKKGERTIGNKSVKTNNNKEINQYKWRLLIDNRERIRGTHDNIIEAFKRAGVNTFSCTLPCGDFMIGLDKLDQDYTENEFNNNNIEENSNSCNINITSSIDKIFSVVIERKTVKDLCASITTSRYYEQRKILSASPFQTIIWIIEGTTEMLRPDEQRRVVSACASLAILPRFRVIRTRHLLDTIAYLRNLGFAYTTVMEKASKGIVNKTPLLGDCTLCLQHTLRVRQALRARTTFPRVLMCVRGCSSGLALQLASKYGSLLHLWRKLKEFGREACDADMDIRCLSHTQKEVYIRLTEFLLTEEYS